MPAGSLVLAMPKVSAPTHPASHTNAREAQNRPPVEVIARRQAAGSSRDFDRPGKAAAAVGRVGGRGTGFGRHGQVFDRAVSIVSDSTTSGTTHAR